MNELVFRREGARVAHTSLWLRAAHNGAVLYAIPRLWLAHETQLALCLGMGLQQAFRNVHLEHGSCIAEPVVPLHGRGTIYARGEPVLRNFAVAVVWPTSTPDWPALIAKSAEMLREVP